MTKYYKRLPLSNKVLKQLITTENSCVEVHRDKKHITLFPFHLKNISVSIREIIDEDIAKYNKDLKGILLGYKNIKLLSDSGILNNDSCFIHIDIEADFILFKPVYGEHLPAIVTKKSKDHVGCLVYNTFNVSLPKPEGIECWTGSTVEIGQEIIIRVTFADLDAKLPYIRGEFLNNTAEEEDNTVESKSMPVAKRIIFEDEEEQVQDIQEESSYKEKRKKKRKTCQEILDNENDESVTDLSHLSNYALSDKKRKKHKRERGLSLYDDETVIIQNGTEDNIRETKSIKSKRKNSSPSLEDIEIPKKKRKSS